jgi:hypothetical protein
VGKHRFGDFKIQPLGDGVSSAAILYTYDPLYPLTNATYSNGTVFSYTHDVVGNRLTQTTLTHTTVYTYNGLGDPTRQVASGITATYALVSRHGDSTYLQPTKNTSSKQPASTASRPPPAKTSTKGMRRSLSM